MCLHFVSTLIVFSHIGIICMKSLTLCFCNNCCLFALHHGNFGQGRLNDITVWFLLCTSIGCTGLWEFVCYRDVLRDLFYNFFGYLQGFFTKVPIKVQVAHSFAVSPSTQHCVLKFDSNIV